jgi:hypothetical protein
MTDPKGTCDYAARKEDPSNWHGDYRDGWMLDYEAPLALEQEVWECPHEALDGEEHRLFHTDPEDVPDDVDESERFVETVNEASAVNDEHPIRLDHASSSVERTRKNAVFEHNVLATRARFETDDEEATIWDEYDNIMTSGMTNGIGYVSFLSAEFEEARVSFNTATVAASLPFLNTRFDAKSTVVLSDAEFRDDVTFGFDGGSASLTNSKNIPSAPHSLDLFGGVASADGSRRTPVGLKLLTRTTQPQRQGQ